jgi:hypothetical protein
MVMAAETLIRAAQVIASQGNVGRGEDASPLQ